MDSLDFGFSDALVIVCVLGAVWCLWGAWCTGVAYYQRKALVAIIAKAPEKDLYRMHLAYDRVSLDDHSRCIMFLRDPHTLYPPDMSWK